MLKIDIEADELQEFSINFEDDLINIILEFRNVWLMNVEFKGKKINGLKLSSQALLLTGKNYPFEIWIDDKNTKLDPLQLDSFSSELFDFYLLERNDINTIRGFKVQ